MENIRHQVRAFLARYIRDREIADDEDIFAAGHVNSLFVMQLVLFVEGELDCPVADEDLELENFSSVDAIVAMVERRTATVHG
ncbi:phosphopantetheine-binding protein [Micromonospora sp. NPDC004551]|uniref:acyl carrier protein n=1 Tax=Micromonospora sp. NPDC004551 TaxID=3154284 RepID=UPI0033BF9655